jgi:hypothetical protein
MDELINVKDIIILPCDVKEIRSFVEKNHYTHSINGVKITQCFKILFEKEIVGGIIYGQLSTTAWKKFSKNENEVLELRRLVLLDRCGKNCESKSIAISLKYIKNNLKNIKTVVSYADPNFGHTGIIYKASNFKYLGVSSSDVGFLDMETNKIYHSRALRTKYKGDYKPFVKKLREKKDKGELRQIKLLGKHCFCYYL